MVHGAVAGLTLMERAGRGVRDAIFREWPDFAAVPHSAVILCGPGNNGGDGFVIARLLRQDGWDVTVFLLGDPNALPPDAQTNCDAWRRLGPARPWDPDEIGETSADLYVDAVFGAGLTRAPSDAVAQTLAGLGGEGHVVVAVDAPSGLCMDSGRALGSADGVPFADLTVTFQWPRIGHYLALGPQQCGRLVCVDIGLDNRSVPPVTFPSDVARAYVGPSDDWDLQKAASAHKYAHGHALICAGGLGKTGAARLAARGALRVGAGLVTVAAPKAAMAECAAHLTAIMCRQSDGPDALGEALSDPRFTSVCLGPGLGVGADTRALVAAALEAKRATVLDADALTAFADASDVLFDALHPDVVLTPHGGEFARLFPDIAKQLDQPPEAGPAFSKVDAVRAAADRAGCVVLFKGPDTVVADPTGAGLVVPAAYDRVAPWLATAGSGDVLSGFIAGLLARGTDPVEAACLGAWLHVEAARAFGPGLIAEDLPETLPHVFRDLGL